MLIVANMLNFLLGSGITHLVFSPIFRRLKVERQFTQKITENYSLFHFTNIKKISKILHVASIFC